MTSGTSEASSKYLSAIQYENRSTFPVASKYKLTAVKYFCAMLLINIIFASFFIIFFRAPTVISRPFITILRRFSSLIFEIAWLIRFSVVLIKYSKICLNTAMSCVTCASSGRGCRTSITSRTKHISEKKGEFDKCKEKARKNVSNNFMFAFNCLLKHNNICGINSLKLFRRTRRRDRLHAIWGLQSNSSFDIWA